MKLQNKWCVAVAAAAALAACGGGSTDAGGIEEPAVTLVETRYATGCIPFGASTYARKADITILGSLDANTTVSADVRTYSDVTCTTQTQRLYAKGVATLSSETKTLTAGSVTKIGRKGQFRIDDVALAGVSLSASPSGAVVNFVIVDEGDKLYFGRGTRDSDGYPSELSAFVALKQP